MRKNEVSQSEKLCYRFLESPLSNKLQCKKSQKDRKFCDAGVQ